MQAKGLLVIILTLPVGETFDGKLRTIFLIALGDILNCIPVVEDVREILMSEETPTRAQRQSGMINDNSTVR